MMQNTTDKHGSGVRPRREGVQAIARAGQVLRALEAAPEGVGLAELAAIVRLPKSTVHRLVAALAEEDLASTSASGRIRLGGGLARLGAATRQTLRHEVRPALEQLRRELDETVDLAILDGRSAQFVDQLAAPHRLRAVSAVGASFPLHCTANGKALLAAMEPDQALALLPVRLERMTHNTITSRTALLEQLEQIRGQGVAYDYEEHTEGICAAGAAIFDAAGPAAAISVPVPTPRFQGNEARYAKLVPAAARAASRLLGGSQTSA
ncbi:MAG TPA: IclR family transcriptional regulator [Solirubrobacteraceae bacterium]|nr:IclR family transcriptional regulator [Solirubrobacteraceae bacterium]